MALLLATVCISSGLHIQRTAADVTGWRIVSLFGFVPLALMEEIPFRGKPFQTLRDRYGLRGAQLFTALAFALYHLLNGWSFAQSFLGPFIWAFVFGIAAAYSRGIALPTGFHAGLNIVQSVAGLGMSGGTAFWVLVDADGRSEGAAEKGTGVGIILQVVILLVAWLATEKLQRKPPLPNGSASSRD